MREFLTEVDGCLQWTKGYERIWIAPWGRNGVRVRVTRQPEFRDSPGGLLSAPSDTGEVAVRIGETESTLTNGAVTVRLTARAQLLFERTSDGAVVLEERVKTTAEYPGRVLAPRGGTWYAEQRFFARDGERIYGLGQRQHGYLDQKGCVLDLLHRNTETSIPFLLSSEGYGFLWNHPGVGRVDLGRNETRWVAESTQQIDYWVVVDRSPAEILARYAEVTGHPTAFPYWASGFWQSKLRYKTQEELLVVAREYRKRGLPLSAIVVDFHHWRQMGDWCFDPELWPDPGAMVRELRSLGIELVVSIWPTVNATSASYPPMEAHGMLVRNERGHPVQNTSNEPKGSLLQTFYDATNPEARRYLWERVREGYVRHGIRAFWLDTSEPELLPLEQDNTRYFLGNGLEVAGLYPLCHSQAFCDGLTAMGEEAPLVLSRSAWAGSQRYGTAVWSADIPSTWDSLRRQVAGGLNIGLSGIPWWTSDIGGFHGGYIDDPSFRELFVRWFQYGVFCPICRVHGIRRRRDPAQAPADPIGDPYRPTVPNEVWSYGEEATAILSEQLLLRERLRPYLMEQMAVAQVRGLPPMRPLFLDYPSDSKAWEVEDQFLLGPEVLVAPVLEEGARSRRVYLPAGQVWRCAWTDARHDGGTVVAADAPLARIPVFIRAESRLQLRDGDTRAARS
jgi:alpha-D-xyloside xylohydrolase